MDRPSILAASELQIRFSELAKLPLALVQGNYIYAPGGHLPSLDQIDLSSRLSHFFLFENLLVGTVDMELEGFKANCISLRECLDIWPSELVQSLTTGAALTNWDRRSRFCGYCGENLTPHPSDLGKTCEVCSESHYPQLQPVVIVLIRKGEELLLARGPAPRKFYSCVAGFTEVGETLEQTVHREVQEEVGVEIQNLKYFGSQPWPFPSNLMIGYIADWKAGEIKIDPAEISDAKWFSKSEPPMLPPKISIARQMIDSLWK